MVRKKKVLVLVEHFGQGGAEKVAAMLADMLHESQRFDVYFYAVYDSCFSQSVNGVTKGTLGISHKPGIVKRISGYYQKISRLKKLKKKLQIDLTISSLWPVDWINVLTGKEKKIAIIQINILNNEQNIKMVRFKKIVTAVYSKLDRVILGSANLTSEWTAFFKINRNRLSVIHNPIDINQINKNLLVELPATIRPLFSNNKVMVVANRLHPVKNTESLIPIVKKLPENKRIKLLIIGEGEEKIRLTKLINEEGLQYSEIEVSSFDENADIYFSKFQDNIHNILSKANVFIFPTKSEGLPLALLEAMYCGVPILVSDCPNGGVSEALDAKKSFDINHPRKEPEFTGGGYLMPIPFAEQDSSIQIWADKIEEVLNFDNSKLNSIQLKNRERAVQFDKEIIKRKWLSLIDDVFNK